jgi:hypothetical protein
MKKMLLLPGLFLLSFCQTIAQTKTIIGIVPFKNSMEDNRYHYNTKNQEVTVIQDAVTDAFLRSKRFSLVEREKMDQIKSEKRLQQNEDFIDGQVIEQSKSLGAEYIVTGNVTKAVVETSQTHAPIAGNITSRNSEVAFNIKVIDVATGEIKASNSFSGNGRGKNSFENAMADIKPELEKFIRDNFKLTASIASVEEKNAAGDAVKVLISRGSSVGMQTGNVLKVYEAKELVVDGKKMVRKVTIGKIIVSKVEDENFSICDVVEGGADIAGKIAASANIKCEIINEEQK